MNSIEVVIFEPRPGWAIIRIPLSDFRKYVEYSNMPGILDRALTDWLSPRPYVEIKHVLPIVEDGYTTALHIWWKNTNNAEL